MTAPQAPAVAPLPRAVQRGVPRARVVLLGGASGSGKTLLTRLLGLPRLELDGFYRDGDDPVLRERFGDGVTDWDDPVTWNAEAAVGAIEALCHEGTTDVPGYDIPTSRCTGTLRLDLGSARLFIAEGIFAAELTTRTQQLGLLADAICLRRNRSLTFVRRLARDLAEARKPVPVLLRRGVRLSREEPAMVHRWDALGCRLVDRDEALSSLRALSRGDGVPQARLHRSVDYDEVLTTAVASVSDQLKTADLTAPVPSCPGWTVHRLVEHLGGVHRWATTAVVEGHRNGEQPAAPTESGELLAWFTEGATTLLDTLRSRDPAEPCWTFAPQRTVAFWWRRQAHETAMHAWDLAAAVGDDRYAMVPDLAADGITEVVDFLVPRRVYEGRTPQPREALTLSATDTGQTWQITGRAGQAPTAAISGTAEALLLLLWHRVDLDDHRLTQGGDRAAARATLSLPLVP